MRTDPIDIENMPGYNPEVTNGVDSVRKGLVSIKIPEIWIRDEYSVNGGYMNRTKYPYCQHHGAMLRVSKDGIYRCGQLGCDTGCYYP